MKRHTTLQIPTAAFAVVLLANAVPAAEVPFTEHFASGPSNWANAAGQPLSWSAGGGVADGAFASGSYNFTSIAAGDRTVFRGSQTLDSSGGAFTGDWLTEGVAGFSAYVRHDAPLPLTFFLRFAGPANFPGAAAINFAPVLPGQWTLIDIPINATNPQFVTFEGSDFNTVFSSIANIQFGVRVPEQLGGSDTNVTFGVDQVSIVPEPAGLMLLGAGGAALLVRGVRKVRRP